MFQTSLHTEFGMVHVGDQQAIFNKLLQAFADATAVRSGRYASVALTGGSTPKAFYQWVSENRHVLRPEVTEKIDWMVSDERCVPLEDPESNFGNADRQLLRPMNISVAQKHPWPVDLRPERAASVFNDNWNKRMSAERCFDLCLLGMGDDCHTASLFPGSPLLEDAATTENFAVVEVPGKGWRLTVTPSGLARCRHVVITVTGAGKAEALKRVFEGDEDVKSKPVQVLKRFARRVTWLMDADAASLLDLDALRR